jgi:hypothetical protein
VLIRQILKHALNSEQLEQLPHIPPLGKIKANPRPWLTPDEYDHLESVARDRIKNAPSIRVKQQRQDVLDFRGFLMASMMRVDELYALRFRDCRVGQNDDGVDFLMCEPTVGKRGSRRAVADLGAVDIYLSRLQTTHPEVFKKDESLDDKNAQTVSDLIFPNQCTDAFRELLIAAGLREDQHGFTRNLKSIRATSISRKILENPDLNLQVIARNAGTSVMMIDMFYAKRLTADVHQNALSAVPGIKKRKVN